MIDEIRYFHFVVLATTSTAIQAIDNSEAR